jgi:membrane protein implicated in regulation of membrane protease activity
MIFLAASVVLMVLVRRLVRRADESSPDWTRGRWLAAASLVCWAGAIAAGRFMAYL